MTIKKRNWKKEELDSVLYEKQIKTATITKSKNELKGTMETNNYLYTVV